MHACKPGLTSCGDFWQMPDVTCGFFGVNSGPGIEETRFGVNKLRRHTRTKGACAAGAAACASDDALQHSFAATLKCQGSVHDKAYLLLMRKPSCFSNSCFGMGPPVCLGHRAFVGIFSLNK